MFSDNLWIRRYLFLGIIFFALAFGILLHQFIFWRVWFTPTDIHHETLAVVAGGVAVFCIFLALVLYFEPKLPKALRPKPLNTTVVQPSPSQPAATPKPEEKPAETPSGSG